MAVTGNQLGELADYLEGIVEGFIDEGWLRDHTTLKFDDATMTMSIEIWDMDEQDYKPLKEAS